MNDIDLVVVVIAFMAMAIVFYTVGANYGGDTQNFLSEPLPISKEGVMAAPVYGESHPINAYDEMLHKTGAYDIQSIGGSTIEDERNKLLYSTGVLNNTEDTQHRAYYQSNVAKYPLVILGDTTELKDTRSPYVGGTRALRAVSIMATESQVPDKLERTARPIFF